jgi:hypothetical protein
VAQASSSVACKRIGHGLVALASSLQVSIRTWQVPAARASERNPTD